MRVYRKIGIREQSRVNYAYINYNNKTGFYENEIGSSTRQKKQSELNHWKCEKCNNILFVTLKELKLYARQSITHTN